jgi:uncharacterized RDD family membrane protein YckC
MTVASTALRTGTPAGFGIRTAAYVVDAFLLSLVGGAFPYIFLPAMSPAGGTSVGAGGASIGTSLLASLIYFCLFWSYLGGGRTPGMRLLGLRVVHEDGSRVELRDAAVRWVGLWASFLVFFLGVLWVIRDPRKQGWHDKMAHTLVLRESRDSRR